MNKVEEVARAISLAQCQTDRLWDAFLPEARAAIEAMRSPTARMLIDAGTMSGWDAYAEASADECHIAWWSDMIDAALSEPRA